MSEEAFKGTVKEGQERRYTIINERDVEKYLTVKEQLSLLEALEPFQDKIERGRLEDGKQPYNNYIVINLDEPYIDEIIEIMKRHGHWG